MNTNKTTRTTISMPAQLFERAADRRESAGYSGFSDYVQELKHGSPPAAAAEDPPGYHSPPKKDNGGGQGKLTA